MQINSQNFEYYKKELYKICNAMVRKSGLNVDDMANYCIAKIVNIEKNYNPKLGKEFKKYFASSIKSYALNYIRDYSYVCTVSRNKTEMVRMIKKHKNIDVASRKMLIPREKLQNLVDEVDRCRIYNMVEISEVGSNLKHNSQTANYFRDIVEKELDDDEFDILEDLLVNSLSKKDMDKKYGLEWGHISRVALEKIEKYRKDYENQDL